MYRGDDDMFEIKRLADSFHVRRLCDADVQDIFNLYLSNPQYFDAMNDAPELSSVKSDLAALPPNKAYDDKYYIGFYDGEALVAAMDLILAFPDEKTAFIGLFMVDGERQGRGIGSSIIRQALEYLKSFGFSACRLGYIKGNQQGREFWTSLGFMPTGEQSKQNEYTVVLMEKRL